MTPAEVLREIRKLPEADKRKLLSKLRDEFDLIEKLAIPSEVFLEAARRTGLLIVKPAGLPDAKIRANFKRSKVKGKPLSQTIIEERG